MLDSGQDIIFSFRIRLLKQPTAPPPAFLPIHSNIVLALRNRHRVLQETQYMYNFCLKLQLHSYPTSAGTVVNKKVT